jgi:hypothetical protein
VYLGTVTVAWLDEDTAHLMGALGRMVPEVDIYAASTEVAFQHPDEVLGRLHTTTE